MTLKSRCCFFVPAIIVLNVVFLVSISTAYDPAPLAPDVSRYDIELGYSTSGMNTIAFRRNAIWTEGNYQLLAYYYDATSPKVAVARRTLGSGTWNIYHFPSFVPNSTDDHDVISFGIDGEGFMHVVWGLHNQTVKYAKSTTSVLNSNPISFSAQQSTMTGYSQGDATYPEFYRVSDGDLLFEWRDGASGSGDEKLIRYDTATPDTNLIWNRIHDPTPTIDGNTSPDDANAYMNNWVIDSTGTIQATWVWRETSDYVTNHDIMYAKSTDQGVTWKRQDGTPYTLPIKPDVDNNEPNSKAQVVFPIGQNNSLMNQTSMAVDSLNRPIVATWYAPDHALGDDTRQYMLVYFNGETWSSSKISHRSNESFQGQGTVRDLGRPVVLVDKDDRTIVVMRYRDSTNSSDVVKVAYSTDKSNWSYVDLTTEDSNNYEPMADPVRWARDGILSLFYQKAGITSGSMVSVLEWNSLKYTRGAITVNWVGGNGSGPTNWGVTANWTNSALPPDGKWTTVSFGNESSAKNVVDMISAGRTVGNITFNATTSTTIQSSGGYSLTLDNSGSSSTITVAGTHTISAPVLMDNDVNVTGGGTLNLSGGVSGSYKLDLVSGNLTAATMRVGTLTLGAGATVTIQALPGGPQGGDLTPVPEPSTLVMLAIGAMLLALGYRPLVSGPVTRDSLMSPGLVLGGQDKVKQS